MSTQVSMRGTAAPSRLPAGPAAALRGAADPATGRLPGTATGAPAASAQPLVVPEWVKDAVFYQAFPERFANGDMGNDPQGSVAWGSPPTNDAMMGGDLQGITQKMGYLTKLGVNALYLNPIFQSPSNHKYNITSFEHVDEAFGGDAAFREMTDVAHRNGVKVMLDGVFNHVSHQHEWFKDVREKGPKSKYFDRFEVTNWPIHYERDADGVLRSKDYKSWWGYATLPVLKTNHPDVREYFLNGKDAVVKRWIRDGKIDGWRMDVADDDNFSADYWREARREIKSANPDAYMVAENWKDASAMLQGDQFDGAMNYQYFAFPAVDFFAKKSVTPDQFVQRLQNGYSKEAKLGMFNILDSHDTARFITQAGGDWYRQRPAAIFQMTYVGAPVIYYGDEIGTEGDKDPDSRRAFDWSLVPGNKTKDPTQVHGIAGPDALHGAAATSRAAAAPGTSGVGGPASALAGVDEPRRQRAQELFGLYQRLIETRRAEPALRRGDFQVLATHNENNTVVYRRSIEGQARDAIVALNNNVAARPISVPLGGVAADGTRFTDAISGRSFVARDGRLDLGDVDGNFGAVLLRDA